MPKDVTWFNFLPGYEQLERYAQAQLGLSFMNHQAIEIQHVLAALLVLVIILGLSLQARMALARSGDNGLVPDAKPSVRNFLEVIAEALFKQMSGIIGPEARRYFPIIGAIGMFIFFSNLLGLIPGFEPPTKNWNTTVACGVFIFLYYNFHGVRKNGFAHITHMANPVGEWWGWFLAPIMFPIELISHLARPLSLSLRLMGNMIGDHAVLGIFVGIFPFLLPLPFYALGLIVCVVQTLVFCLLSMVYISLAVQDAHKNDEEAHEALHAH